MTANKKKAATNFGTRAASNNRAGRDCDIRRRIKAAIVRLALWGVLPVAVAEWLIHRGVMRHE